MRIGLTLALLFQVSTSKLNPVKNRDYFIRKVCDHNLITDLNKLSLLLLF